MSVAVLALVVLVLWSAFPERKHQATGQPGSFLPSVPAQHAVLSEPIATIVGRVVAVTDGDTIAVIGADGVRRRVRIAGIDAPEIGQDFGAKAKRNLSALLNGQTVTVFSSKNDDYGRVVGKVVLDGRDVALELIKSGFAWHFKRYEHEQSEADRKAYSDAESLARLYAMELWSLPSPIAPWDYRNGTAVSEELKTKFFGNKNSLIYHWWGCPGFLKISLKNRVVFESWEEAEFEGYRAAANCSEAKPLSAEISDHFVTNVPAPTPTPLPYYRVADEALRNYQPAPTPYAHSTPYPGSTPYVMPLRSPRDTLPGYQLPELPQVESSLPSAICSDGSVSQSVNNQGTCSHHGGVSTWLNGSSTYPSYTGPRSSDVYVRPYTRRDGTYVDGHYRTAPNNSAYDNYSTRGNINPYTGRRGTKRP